MPSCMTLISGESYLDCYHRISPVVADIKATPSPVLVVAHQAILRCMVGAMTDRPPDVVPYIDIPQYEVTNLHYYTALLQHSFQAQTYQVDEEQE